MPVGRSIIGRSIARLNNGAPSTGLVATPTIAPAQARFTGRRFVAGGLHPPAFHPRAFPPRRPGVSPPGISPPGMSHRNQLRLQMRQPRRVRLQRPGRLDGRRRLVQPAQINQRARLVAPSHGKIGLQRDGPLERGQRGPIHALPPAALFGQQRLAQGRDLLPFRHLGSFRVRSLQPGYIGLKSSGRHGYTRSGLRLFRVESI